MILMSFTMKHWSKTIDTNALSFSSWIGKTLTSEISMSRPLTIPGRTLSAPKNGGEAARAPYGNQRLESADGTPAPRHQGQAEQPRPGSKLDTSPGVNRAIIYPTVR